MSELISVIIPVYKVEKYLNKCIESVVKQTYKNIEIIIIDDGSPDMCPEMCDEWARKDARIKVIHQQNKGLSSARNIGIKKAIGDYILFVDSDDYIDNYACEKLIKYAEGVDLVVAEATIYEPGKVIHRCHTNLEENYIYSGTECAIKAIQAGEWFAAACYNMYKRQFILDNQLFFVTGILHEDIEYLPRLFLAAKTVKYMRYEFYQYVTRQESICGTKTPKHLEDLMTTYENWAKLNRTINDGKTKKMYSGALSKYFIATCRNYRVAKRVFPVGINELYLLKNALNARELVKTLLFVFLRPVYVNILQNNERL